MLPELRSAMHDSMPDGGRCRHFGVGKKSSDADDRVSLAGNGYRLGRTAFSRQICAWNLAVLLPIDSASPESSISVREDLARYNPNLSEEEPLFSPSPVNAGSASVIPYPAGLISSSTSRGPPACPRHAR